MRLIIMFLLLLPGMSNYCQNVGIGTISPQSKLSVGANSEFQVDLNGNLIMINNVPYSFPYLQGGYGKTFVNDGAGNFSWREAGVPLGSIIMCSAYDTAGFIQKGFIIDSKIEANNRYYTSAPGTWRPFANYTPLTGSPYLTDYPGVWANGKVMIYYNNFVYLWDTLTTTWSVSSANSVGGFVFRYGASAVWTGTDMIIFGGQNGTYYNNAVKYNPSSNTWTAIANAPEKKAYHTAVWTGTEMIVWGGDSSSVNPLAGTGITKTGYKYNPTLNTWSAAISTTGAPNARYDHGAVWTGTKMLIFAGTSYTPPSIVSSSYANYDLYAYDATGNTWSMLSSSFNETFHPRCVWTGTDMIAITPVYARVNNQLYTLLQKYNPGSDLWTNLANEGQYVSPGTVVWDGANMIITQGQLLQRFTLSGSGNYYYLPQLTSYYLMRKIYNY